MSLTPNGVACLLNNKTQEVLPYLQIIEIKKITTNSSSGAKDRYRLLINDGQFCFQAMASSQTHPLIENNTLRPFCIVQVKQSYLNEMPNGKKLLVLLNLEVTGYQESVSGDPQIYNSNQSAPSTTTTNTATVQQNNQVPVVNNTVAGGSNFPAANQARTTPVNNTAASSNMGMQNTSFGGNTNNTMASGAQPTALKSNNSFQNNTGASRPVQNSFSSGNAGITVQGYNSGQTAELRNVRAGDVIGTMPIFSLTSFTYGWKIKARITKKSTIRRWEKNGGGTLFTIDLLDESGGEVQGTFFKESVDKYYEALLEDNVYTFAGGQVKYANERSLQYSRIKNQYQISFNEKTEIDHVIDDTQIKCLKAHFVPIDQINSKDSGSVIDVIGIVHSHSEAGEINIKTGTKSRRGLTIIDSSNCTIELTLWGEYADKDNGYENHPVIAVSGCRVGDYNGKSLSTSFDTRIHVNPNIPEAEQIANWYNNNTNKDSVKSLSNATGGGGGNNMKHTYLADVEEKVANMGEKPMWHTIDACVIYIRQENTHYLACVKPKCNKKVIEEEPGNWRCETCNTSTTEPLARYILSARIADHTGAVWASIYDKEGAELLGTPAQTLKEMKDSHNDREFSNLLSGGCFKEMKMNLVAKRDVYQGESRLKYAITRMEPVNCITRNERLVSELERYELMGPVA